MVYLDTSILGSYYCPESLSDIVNQAILSLDNSTISVLAEVELCSLVSLKVRMHELSRVGGQQALARFRQHVGEGHYEVLEIGFREYDTARAWLSGFHTSLRTVDALHMACAFVRGMPVWTTDRSMARAAALLQVRCRLIAV